MFYSYFLIYYNIARQFYLLLLVTYCYLYKQFPNRIIIVPQSAPRGESIAFTEAQSNTDSARFQIVDLVQQRSDSFVGSYVPCHNKVREMNNKIEFLSRICVIIFFVFFVFLIHTDRIIISYSCSHRFLKTFVASHYLWLYSSNEVLLTNSTDEMKRIEEEMKECGLRAVNTPDYTKVDEFVRRKFRASETGDDDTQECIIPPYVTSGPNSTDSRLQHAQEERYYASAMTVFCDMKSGKAFGEDYVWPTIPRDDDETDDVLSAGRGEKIDNNSNNRQDKAQQQRLATAAIERRENKKKKNRKKITAHINSDVQTKEYLVIG